MVDAAHSYGHDDAGYSGEGGNDITDRGEKCWLDHGGADSEQHSCGKPDPEVLPDGDDSQCAGLDKHPADDQGFAADPVRKGAGDELPGSPDRGING